MRRLTQGVLVNVLIPDAGWDPILAVVFVRILQRSGRIRWGARGWRNLICQGSEQNYRDSSWARTAGSSAEIVAVLTKRKANTNLN